MENEPNPFTGSLCFFCCCWRQCLGFAGLPGGKIIPHQRGRMGVMAKTSSRLVGLAPIAIGGAMFVAMAYQIYTGKTGRHVVITRDGNPELFWCSIAIWGVFGTALVGLGVYALLYGDPGRKS
jgi:hypothetical protein